MHPRKLKIEFFDSEGIRHSITVDGPVSREKVARILDLVEIMSGFTIPSPTALGLSSKKLDRLASTIITNLRDKPFTSTEARQTFERVYGEKIPLSTVSTYLSRLVDRGLLARRPDSDPLRYEVTLERQQPLPASPLASPPTSQN